MNRREKQEADLSDLEAKYRTRLIADLKDCSAGYLELFGTNEHLEGEYPFLQRSFREARDLIAFGERIEKVRVRLGFSEPFALHQRFLEYRRMRGPNCPGETRQAIRFLDELNEGFVSHASTTRRVATDLGALVSVLGDYKTVSDKASRRQSLPKRRIRFVPTFEWECGCSAKPSGGTQYLTPCSDEHARAVEAATADRTARCVSGIPRLNLQ